MTQQNQETVTKQKNPLRVEQGRKLVEYNKGKKEELKRLNDRITKQDNIADHKPRPHTNAYVYVGGLSVLGLAIGGYLLYNKFKGELQRQNKLISSERLFKILQNESKIIQISQAVLEIFNFKD